MFITQYITAVIIIWYNVCCVFLYKYIYRMTINNYKQIIISMSFIHSVTKFCNQISEVTICMVILIRVIDMQYIYNNSAGIR